MSNRSGYARVNRHHPCPVCAKPDNCSVSEDGKWCICGRVTEGAHKVLRNGAGLHCCATKPQDVSNSRPSA
jgi:hypothetical protein